MTKIRNFRDCKGRYRLASRDSLFLEPNRMQARIIKGQWQLDERVTLRKTA